MDISHLSFEISFRSLKAFADHWASCYSDGSGRDKIYYDPHINAANLRTDDAALKALFTWKNGGAISERKTGSICENYFRSPTEDADLESRYLDPNQAGGPIWNIFYLHCRQPSLYAIFDQHAYRAMNYMQGRAACRDLAEESPDFVYTSYRKEYRPFFAEIVAATGYEPRTIDRALYTFGQFLKRAQPCLRKDRVTLVSSTP